jgi:hypothetical protein
MNLTPDQKLAARKSIAQATSFLESVRQIMIGEVGGEDQIPHLLTRVDGALFDLRQTLSVPDLQTAAIMDEYQEDL